MTTTALLIRKRRFLPLFATQLLGAFNDNLYKNAMILYVVYTVYHSEAAEARFSAIASAVFILPFFLVGATGLFMAWRGMAVEVVAIPLMLAALLAMGVHSTFFGPIKYAILPQHLHADEVLAGTGLVEAGTYISILAGTIFAGWIPVEWAAMICIGTAMVGFCTAQFVPPAPPQMEPQPLDFNVLRSSITLVRMTTRHPRVYLAIAAISFFWTIGAVLFILVVFSIGVAIGSVSINHLLKGTVSARYGPISVIVMGLFVVAFHFVCKMWQHAVGSALLDVPQFVMQPLAVPLLLSLLGIAISGGMFVVPLYAFLTTVVDKAETARTIAANNIVNAGAMVVGSLIAVGLSAAGVALADQLLLGAAMCLVAAWLARVLYRAERAHAGEIEHTFE